MKVWIVFHETTTCHYEFTEYVSDLIDVFESEKSAVDFVQSKPWHEDSYYTFQVKETKQ